MAAKLPSIGSSRTGLVASTPGNRDVMVCQQSVTMDEKTPEVDNRSVIPRSLKYCEAFATAPQYAK